MRNAYKSTRIIWRKKICLAGEGTTDRLHQTLSRRLITMRPRVGFGANEHRTITQDGAEPTRGLQKREFGRKDITLE